MSTPMMRPAIRNLVDALLFREGMHSPCWVMRTHDNCALVVPTMMGTLEFLRCVKRRTLDDAEALGLLAVGEALETVPPYGCVPLSWLSVGATKGRTIALAPVMDRPLEPRNFGATADRLDRWGVFVKEFTQDVNGKITVVGLRVGVRPDHVVAFYGDTIVRAADGGFEVRRSATMSAPLWNYLHKVGTPVVAYPAARPDHPAYDPDSRLEAVTRTPAWTLGHGQPVVSVEGYAGGIALTHIDLAVGGTQ